MGMDNQVVLTSFVQELDAQMVVMELQAGGIDAVLQKDDCGGMRPFITSERGIEVLVPAADLQRAREILALIPNEEAEAVALEKPRRRLSKIDLTAMLVVGIVVGSIGSWVYVKDKYFVREAEIDRNGDGVTDQVWFYGKDGYCTGGHADNNFDGKWDEWHTFVDGAIDLTKTDTDFNGVPDVEWKYLFGVAAQENWRPNGAEVVNKRVFLKHGIPVRELVDSDRNGTFDLETGFDAFGNKTNSMPVQK
ncbi:hypothetical protein PDESU_06516 [Pontiella desulfatans]|uniref:DUF2007 domain-containing protein n=1 Tax=Pontiella desulfatans TaxID=2750659 RepID=A0A6C2UEW9_PONDE|nr:DUF2007 domain-containing protein [Pontiella desulfatans]VGO17914.1 hypothetical protein PDESU_06516 [Pontiella desulfatans]